MNKLKITLNVLLLGILIIIFNSCSKNDSTPTPKSNTINRIMPLGASRVQGNRPAYESFRYELWKDLNSNGWQFDFIGTQKDKASYPSINGENFDVDNEGRSGWTSGEILDNINTWLNAIDTPDIVLFSSPAGNDALLDLPYNDAISNINGIIDALQTFNPNITILLEQMAPGHTSITTQKLNDYFNDLQQEMLTIATNKTNSNSKVITVDMFTGFTNSMLADPVHYNESGADYVASRYYNALVNVLEN